MNSKLALPERVIVFGATGLVGNKLSHQMERLGILVKRPRLRIQTQSLKNERKIKKVISDFLPDAVVNCAAIIGTQKCLENIKLAETVNHWLPEMIGSECDSVGSFMLHLSTEAVFRSAKLGELMSIEDLPEPETIYGLTKFTGEKSVLQWSNNLVVRLPRVFDWEKQLIGTLCRRLLEKGEIKVAQDVMSTPISANSAATHLVDLLLRHKKPELAPQLIHLTGDTYISLYDLMLFLTPPTFHSNIKPVQHDYFGSSKEPPLLNAGLLSQPKYTIPLTSSKETFFNG